MKNNLVMKFFFIAFSSIILVSCSQSNNNIDLSNLPKPKKIKITGPIEKDIGNKENQLLIKDLIPFESKEKLLSKFQFGKKDPFSKNITNLNTLGSNFKLKGFVNTEFEKYVFVSYLGNEGTISENSVGGLNTKLLPNGAKVITIDPEEKILKITFDNEDYIFEL